jgi:hypothetical protein
MNTPSSAPDSYFETNLGGDYLYQSFVDANSGYGISELERQPKSCAKAIFPSAKAWNVNEGIKVDFRGNRNN